MENPMTWGRAEHIVSDAYQRWHEMNEAGACGLSLPRHITDALRREGLLRDEDDAEKPPEARTTSPRPNPWASEGWG